MYYKFLMIGLLVILCQGSTLVNDDSPRLVMKDGRPYTGMADFKFAIVGEGMTLWSNDASSKRGEEPRNGLSLQVNEGVF